MFKNSAEKQLHSKHLYIDPQRLLALLALGVPTFPSADSGSQSRSTTSRHRQWPSCCQEECLRRMLAVHMNQAELEAVGLDVSLASEVGSRRREALRSEFLGMGQGQNGGLSWNSLGTSGPQTLN